MATLDKIKICGIRSFGCEEEDVQTVRFQKPLTLILGENGCGKSTIIECLRYLTAQKEPAGKGTFVHDPSLTNRATTKGFVKLRMRDVKGAVVDLCRQVQATRTKKSLTTKSLDNVITRTNKETKEKVSISNRCADFTYEISRIFGVSRSILENVVFCTQEDSHWPLDTDQKLKEKFDQIFDSDRYNKCVNKVREKRKKIKDCVKNSEVELKYLRENKSMAAEKRRRIEKMRIQVDSCNNEVNELNSSLEYIENKLKEINEKELNISKNHAAKEMKKAELKAVQEILTELKNRIKHPYEGSDEDLKSEINSFKKQLSVRQEEVEASEIKMKQLDSQETKLSNKLMEEQGILGQLLKEDELNSERVEQRNEELIKLAAKLNIDVPPEQTEDSIQAVIKDVMAKIMDEEDNLSKIKQLSEEEDQNYQMKIDKLREESLMLQNEVRNKEKNLKTNQDQKQKIKQELLEMDQSAGKLNALETKLTKLNKEIQNIQDSTNVEDLKISIKKYSKERNMLDEKVSELEDEVKRLQQQSSFSAELDIQKDLKSNKDSAFRRLINKHEDNLKALLGVLPDSRFKSAIQNRFTSVRQKVKDLNNLRSKKEKELTELEMKRKHLKEKYKGKEDILQTIEEEIYEACGSDDFEETVSQVQKEVEELQDVKGTLSSSEFMYQRYIRALQKSQPCCPLCHRDFEQQNEARSLVDELMGKIREVPNKLQENKSQLEERQSKYNKLLTLKSKHNEISHLKEKEIPGLRSELEKVESTLKKVQKELADIGKEMNGPQSDEALCLSLLNDMVLLDELQMERDNLGKQIEKLQAEIRGSDGSKDTLKQVTSEYENTRQNLKLARQKIDELQCKLNNYNEDIQQKQSIRNSLVEEINKIQGGIGKRKSLTDRMDELEEEEAFLHVELNEISSNCATVKNKLEDIISERKSKKTKNLDKIERMSHSVSRLLKDLHDVEMTNKIIEAHQRKGIDERIDAVQGTMKKMEEEIIELKKKKEEVTRNIENIKKGLSNQELRERELEENLRLRQKSIQAEDLQKEVAYLESKCGSANFDAILREKRKLKSKEEEITKNKAQIQGRLGEMESQMKILEKELLSKTFRNIDETFNNEYLKCEVWKAIGSDLDRYATTMEYAMMTYHKQQMTKVNAFVREYWRRIYQGNDIDYIEIQTDTIESTEKRRNYNYKVVQVKSDVHLDMRNRCSAGQKMLASLIIRLALAETFSTNCGILTLDEPTTNLDRRNIKNLARTLNEVLLSKQLTSNPNFQLIVITHDEEFLQELMELDLVNEYVKVDRSNRGKTLICNRALTKELNLGKNNQFPEMRQYDYD
ncbi:hypothetical protein RUM43_013132 [Polyplax serrata]|uniref:Zinc-hook domain-containing protein n=1 Tax=Polyplax serrata TaxID=468196 RepID=A0AAN8RSM4_POLSC